MIKERVDIEVYGRKLSVEIEGLTELEVHALAEQLSEKMASVARESGLVDSSKLAILTALETIAELSRVKAQHEYLRRSEDRTLDQVLAALRLALERAIP